MLLLFLLLFLLEGLYHTVDGRIPACLVHLGQCLQAVLQLHGTEMRLQFAQHLSPELHRVVHLVLLVEHAGAGRIGAGGLDIVFLLPVYLAQPQQQHGLGDGVALAFLRALLVGTYAAGGVGLAQIDVADGVVYLVQIVLVLVVLQHAPQAGYGLAALARGHNLGLHDACVEGQFVGRIAPDYA